MAQSLQQSKPAKSVPRLSQKPPKLVRHSELFGMSAGRPSTPPTRTIRQPRRKLIETETLWNSRSRVLPRSPEAFFSAAPANLSLLPVPLVAGGRTPCTHVSLLVGAKNSQNQNGFPDDSNKSFCKSVASAGPSLLSASARWDSSQRIFADSSNAISWNFRSKSNCPVFIFFRAASSK
jgi:hypothetical protein